MGQKSFSQTHPTSENLSKRGVSHFFFNLLNGKDYDDALICSLNSGTLTIDCFSYMFRYKVKSYMCGTVGV